jgi:hypothetical protein
VSNKAYLGDGAYAEYDNCGIRLTAENGLVATDTVYLEPEVLIALMRYIHHKTSPQLAAAVWKAIEGG